MRSFNSFINENVMPPRNPKFNAYNAKYELEIVDTWGSDVAIAVGKTFEAGSKEQREIENYITKDLGMKIKQSVDKLSDGTNARNLGGESFVYVIELLPGGKYQVNARVTNSYYPEFGASALK